MRSRRVTPWARRRRRVYVVCLLCSLLLVPLVGWRMRVKSEVSREREALKAMGIPTTAEDLEAWQARFPALPPVEEYGKAATAFAVISIEDQPFMPSFHARHAGPELFTVPYEASMSGSMRHFVALNDETLRLIRAGRLGGVEGRASGVDRREGLQQLMTLCCASACINAEDGNGDGAAESVLDGIALLMASNGRPWSRSLASSADEVEQLMCALASSASRATLPEDKLHSIQDALGSSDWVEEARQSSTFSISNRLVSFASEQLDSPPARIADVFFGHFDRYMTFTMRSQRFRFEQIGKSIEEQKAAYASMKGWRMRREVNFSGPPMHLAVARAGIEVICYFQKTGALPEQLDVVARDGLDLSDFFSGGQLKYNRVGQSFVVYSVGNDLQDGGGDGRSDVAFRGGWPVPAGAVQGAS